jgi:hypothetical protein
VGCFGSGVPSFGIDLKSWAFDRRDSWLRSFVLGTATNSPINPKRFKGGTSISVLVMVTEANSAVIRANKPAQAAATAQADKQPRIHRPESIILHLLLGGSSVPSAFKSANI